MLHRIKHYLHLIRQAPGYIRQAPGYIRQKRHYLRPVPRGYRIAHLVHSRPLYIACPIGLHLIARAIHRIWEWTLCYRPSRLEQIMNNAYDLGHEHGYRVGRKHAFTEMRELSERTKRVIENSVNRPVGRKYPFLSKN